MENTINTVKLELNDGSTREWRLENDPLRAVQKCIIFAIWDEAENARGIQICAARCKTEDTTICAKRLNCSKWEFTIHAGSEILTMVCSL